MPMQPRPRAETSRPLIPKLRFSIAFSFHQFMMFLRYTENIGDRESARLFFQEYCPIGRLRQFIIMAVHGIPAGKMISSMVTFMLRSVASLFNK